MKIHTSLEFQPIGQGCFYTGRIEVMGTKIFHFVYDCGSVSNRSYLNDEIDDYRNHHLKDRINMVVISHFHEDHVNGIVRLLKNIHCERLIIPYYEVMERLLLYAITDSRDDDYRRMLQDPIAFFNGDGFDIGEIIVIGSPDNPDLTIRQSTEVELTRPSLESLQINENNSEIFQYHDSHYSNEYAEKQYLLKSGEFSQNNGYQLFLAPYHLRIGTGIWEYAFYLDKFSNKKLMFEFTAKVNEILEKNKLTILDMFADGNIEELTDLYSKLYDKDLNNTSLLMYHGPYFHMNGNYHFNTIGCNLNHIPKKHGSMLTGDIDLHTIKQIKKMTNYYGNYINDVCVFQVPHHGAKNNWCMKHNHGLDDFYNYVINHGLGRAKHPSRDVLHDIKTKTKHKKILINNEINEVKIDLYFS